MTIAQVRTKAELTYISNVFLRTGAIAVTWFGLTGLVLNGLSERISIRCDRNEESVPECQLSTKHLFTESSANGAADELLSITNRLTGNTAIPGLTEWEMEVVSSRGKVRFNSYGLAKTNDLEDFTNRTNRFLDTPQLRTFAISSDYSFWFKLLSQGVAGVSIIAGLFTILRLYFAVKYASDRAAQKVKLDQLFGEMIISKPTEIIQSTSVEKVRE